MSFEKLTGPKWNRKELCKTHLIHSGMSRLLCTQEKNFDIVWFSHGHIYVVLLQFLKAIAMHVSPFCLLLMLTNENSGCLYNTQDYNEDGHLSLSEFSDLITAFGNQVAANKVWIICYYIGRLVPNPHVGSDFCCLRSS